MLSPGKGKNIAEEYLAAQISQHPLNQYQFGELRLKAENERFWTFFRHSEDWFDAGYVPGSVYACVDKDDGHLWSRDELEAFYLAKAAQGKPDSAAT